MSESPSVSKFISPSGKFASSDSPDNTKPPSAKYQKRRDGYKPNRMRPNAFVSLPITSSPVIQKLTSMQEAIKGNYDAARSMEVPPATFHLTLLVINIDIEKQKDAAQKALAKCTEEINPILAGTEFKFALNKISSFGCKVVFVTMSDETEVNIFKEAAGKIKSIFTDYGLPSASDQEAVPHVTLFKGRGEIPSHAYESIPDIDCGVETFQTLQLCSMGMKKQDSGYYHIICDSELNP